MRSVLTQMLKRRIKLRSAVHLFAPQEPAKSLHLEVFCNFLPGVSGKTDRNRTKLTKSNFVQLLFLSSNSNFARFHVNII